MSAGHFHCISALFRGINMIIGRAGQLFSMKTGELGGLI
jgi:hypothetical protein